MTNKQQQQQQRMKVKSIGSYRTNYFRNLYIDKFSSSYIAYDQNRNIEKKK